MAITPVGLNSFWYPSLNSSMANLINGGSNATRQNDELFNSAKSAIASLKQIREQQAQYKKQVREFSDATHSLYSDAVGLTYMSSKQTDADTTRQVKDAVDSYNRLVGGQNNSSLSTKGKAVLTSLQTTVTGREKDLNKIGITVDSSTGKLNLNEKDFQTALTNRKQDVYSTLSGDKGVGALMKQAVKPTVSRPLTEFLKAPTAGAGYGRGLSYALQYLTGEGMFMNLLA